MTDTEDHKQKMQAMQKAQAAKVADAVDPDRGLILVHTGNGKGKSSSAFGVLIRALGWKQTVGVVQFIKGKWITGERQFFQRLGGVDWHTMGEGFTWDTQDRDRDIAAAKAAYAKAREMMESGNYDVILLDEINIALRYDYLTVEEVLEGLKARHKRTGVILTGRDAPDALIEYADLVSDMTEVKHPYKSGIKAQRGVDF
ncbi:MAG: cob(I)yrinic acid a,c-diamide adenosyltransferase [Paracoccaceae bacterium]